MRIRPHSCNFLIVGAAVAAIIATILASAAQAAPRPKPMFVTLPAKPATAAMLHRPQLPGSNLKQWNGSFVDTLGQTVNYTMVGTDPSAGGVRSTVPVILIPLRFVYGKLNGNTSFDPTKITVSNGKTVVDNLIASPLLRGRISYVQGGTHVGRTQYIDAFQRANFWSSVKSNRGYHVILTPLHVLPVQTIKVSPLFGQTMTNPFGTETIGTMEIDVFDRKIQGLMGNFGTEISSNALVLFVSANIYLTEGTSQQVCCIGGYHSALGSQPDGQTYGYATYDTEPGTFAQDVSAFSHEIGEWMDDPFVDNSVNCLDNQSMEDGDPLENNANYGGFPYALNGFTYNLQSLVFLGYFGAPASTSLHKWLSFQNDETSVCPGQGLPAGRY